MNRKIVYPDYKNCIANLPNSILKKFGAEPVGEPLAMAEPYLARPYRNVVVFLLDGMGKAILERHLPKDGPFRTNLKGIYTSTFLSTTVAATTSMMSGLQPCEHSWLGWDCYYPQIDKNVTCFYNFVQGTEEKAAEFNVPWTFTPYESVVEKIGKLGRNAVMYAPFWEPKTDSIREMCERVKTTLREPGEHYIYVYWNQPDGLLHRNGCGACEGREKGFLRERVESSLRRPVPPDADGGSHREEADGNRQAACAVPADARRLSGDCHGESLDILYGRAQVDIEPRKPRRGRNADSVYCI